jgi:hypothetical protein
VENDYVGAQHAGMVPIVLDDRGRFADTEMIHNRIASLGELIS